MTSHNITLPDELSRDLSGKVNSGQYASLSEVIRSYVRVGQRVEEQHELRKKRLEKLLAQADRDFENGNYVTLESSEEVSSFLMDRAKQVIKRKNA